jgi:hypothetical protein
MTGPTTDANSSSLGYAVTASKNGTIFPTLALKLQQGDSQSQMKPFLANSANCVPFETDLFQGKMVLMLETPNGRESDPIYQERIFEVKNRSVSSLYWSVGS